MEWTKERMERYARHRVLKEIGEKGQERLFNGKVLLIGTGGLGSPAAFYLAAAGIGTIGIADADVVDLSNLQRQIIHNMQSLGRPKVESAKERIHLLNPDVHVVTYKDMVTSHNIADIIRDQDYDFIIDGTDNFSSKFLINDACVLLGKPFCHAGVVRFGGQAMTYVPGAGPCYRCVFDAPPPEGAVPSSKEVGILGAIPGVMGGIQATEAVKYILGAGQLLTGRLLMYDGLAMTFRTIPISRSPECAVCGDHPAIASLE